MASKKLTSEEQASVDAWNAAGSEVTEGALKRFLPDWFGNIRDLIAELDVSKGVYFQDIKLVADRYASKHSIVLLGSGPSAYEIARDLPYNPDMLLVCGPTCVGTLLALGRQPDVIMVADSNPTQYSILEELRPSRAHEWKIILPITADPSWYSEKSIFNRSQFFFYLPFLDYFGSHDLAYNDILHALIPEIHTYISQAGSVGNAMIGFAEMLCQEDALKRIYLGFDCCGWLEEWAKLRTPSARKLPDNAGYELFVSDLQKRQNVEESQDALIVHSPSFDLQTNLTSLGYAVQMLYLAHIHSQSPNREKRFVMLSESSRLFSALAQGILMPMVRAFEVGCSYDLMQDESWAYSAMLKLIEVSNAHRAKLIAGAKENEHAKERVES
jgi:hypothetical protein